jgi:hypothetical protein
MTERELLLRILKNLKRRLKLKPPDVFILDVAKLLMILYPREALPDWVEILANGNPEMIEAVIATALEDIQADPEEDDDER